MYTHETLSNYLGSKADRPAPDCPNNTRCMRVENDNIAIVLHGTRVVTFAPDGDLTLNSGGWHTATTKTRINSYLGGRATLWQERGAWFVILTPRNANEPVPFADGMTLHPDGTISGAGVNNAAARRKLQKTISEYCKAFAAAVSAADVPVPGPGDCFYCYMVDCNNIPVGEAVHNLSHLESHLEKSYFVPSLLVRAVALFPVGSLIYEYMARAMHGEPVPDGFKDVVEQQLTSSLRRYLRRQFGLAG